MENAMVQNTKMLVYLSDYLEKAIIDLTHFLHFCFTMFYVFVVGPKTPLRTEPIQNETFVNAVNIRYFQIRDFKIPSCD